MKNLIKKIISLSFLFIINSSNLSCAMEVDDKGISSSSSAEWVLDEDLREQLGSLPTISSSSSSRKRLSEEELERAPYTAMDVANYFLAHDFSRRLAKEQGEEGKDEYAIDPLKLQKLLYYVQGYYLAFTGKPLFEEDVLGWKEGPVVPNIYHSFKRFGSRDIDNFPYEVRGKSLSDRMTEAWSKIKVEDKPYLRTIYKACLSSSGLALSQKTHIERPWYEKRDQARRKEDPLLEHDILKDFFQGTPFLEFLIVGMEEKAVRKNFFGLMNFIRTSNIFNSSQDRMEEYRSFLNQLKDKLTLSSAIKDFFKSHRYTFDQFSGQSLEEAILGSFFFPDIIETGFDPESVYFQHRTIPTLLSFSAYYKNPIAIFYLSRMMKELGYEKMEEALREKSKNIFESTVEQNPQGNPESDLSILGTSLFYLAEIDKQEGEWSVAEEKLSRASRLLLEHGNAKRLFQVARRTDVLDIKKEAALKARNGGISDSNIVLATLEEYKNQRSSLLQKAIKGGSAQACYTFGGLMLEETPHSKEAVVLLKKGIKCGSYGAALYLAEKKLSNALEAYDIAFQRGFQSAYYHKYLYLAERNRLEEAKEALLESGTVLMDEELSGLFSEGKQEEIKSSISEYLKELVDAAGCEFIENYDDSGSEYSSPQDIPEEENEEPVLGE